MNQKHNWLAALAAIGAVSVGAWTMADDDDETPPPPTTKPALHVSLQHEMEAMDRDYGTLRKQLKDPTKNESSLAAVIDMEQHTLAAKAVAPKSATTMPTPEANAEKLDDYQAMMINVLRQELDLEEQLRATQNEKAIETLAALHQLETEGHKDFRPKGKRG